MCNNYQKIGELDGFDLVECDECYHVAIVLSNGDFEEVHQCEYCDEFYRGSPVPFPDDNKKFQFRTYCSDDCANEAYEEVRIQYAEDGREFELYGNDLDSWYR